VTDDALTEVRQFRPKPSEAQFREAFRRWSRMANAYGITSVFDAAASPPMVDAYRAADLAGELKLRVVAAQLVDPARGPEQVGDMIAAACAARVSAPTRRRSFWTARSANIPPPSSSPMPTRKARAATCSYSQMRSTPWLGVWMPGVF